VYASRKRAAAWRGDQRQAQLAVAVFNANRQVAQPAVAPPQLVELGLGDRDCSPKPFDQDRQRQLGGIGLDSLALVLVRSVASHPG